MVYITNWSLEWCLWNTKIQYYDVLNGKRQTSGKNTPLTKPTKCVSYFRLSRETTLRVFLKTLVPYEKSVGANMCGSLSTVSPTCRVTRTQAHQVLCLRNLLSSVLGPHYSLVIITIFIYFKQHPVIFHQGKHCTRGPTSSSWGTYISCAAQLASVLTKMEAPWFSKI